MASTDEIFRNLKINGQPQQQQQQQQQQPAFGASGGSNPTMATSAPGSSAFGAIYVFGTSTFIFGPTMPRTGLTGAQSQQQTRVVGTATTSAFGMSTASPFNTATSAFGATSTAGSTGLFGSKPLFGTATTSAFGMSTAGSTGLFGSKPAGFGTTTTPSTSFGSTSAGGFFGQQQKPFGAAAPQPGTPAPTAFGQPANKPTRSTGSKRPVDDASGGPPASKSRLSESGSGNGGNNVWNTNVAPRSSSDLSPLPVSGGSSSQGWRTSSGFISPGSPDLVESSVDASRGPSAFKRRLFERTPIGQVSSENEAQQQSIADKLENAEKVNIEIQGNIQNLKRQIEDARESSAAMSAELAEVDERFRLVKEDLNKKSKIVDKLTVERSKCQDEIDALNAKSNFDMKAAENLSGHLKSERLQEKLNGIKNDNSKLRIEIQSLDAKLRLKIDFLNKKITNAKELLGKAQRKIQIRQEAQAKVGQMKSKVEANKFKLGMLQDKHEFLCEEFDVKYNTNCKKMNDMYEEEKKLCEEIEGQITNLKAELAIAKATQMAGPKSPTSTISQQNLSIQPKAVGPQTPKPIPAPDLKASPAPDLKASPAPDLKASPAPKAKPAPEAKFAVSAPVRKSRGQTRATMQSNPKTNAWDDDDDDIWALRNEPKVYSKYAPLRRRSETQSKPEDDETKREKRTLLKKWQRNL